VTETTYRRRKQAPAWLDLGLSLAARGAGAPLAFVTNVIVARLLGPAGYGSYLSLLSAGLLAGAVALFGVHRVTTREVATAPEDRQHRALVEVLRWALRFGTFTSIAAMLALLLWLWSGLGLVPSGWLERLLVVALVPLAAGTLLTSSVLLGLGNTAASQALTNAIKNGVLLVAVFVLYLFAAHATTALVLACQVIAYVASIGLGIVWTRAASMRLPRAGTPEAAAGHPPPSQAPNWRRAASFFFISSAAVLLMGRLDVVLVNGLAGPTAAGIFGAANRLIQIAMIGGLVLMGWLQPRLGRALANRDHHRLRTLWWRGTVLSAGLTLVPVAAAWLLAPWLMGLLGAGFGAAVSPFRWLLLGTALWGTTFPVGNALLSVAEREHVLAKITWVQLAITVAAVFVLAPRLGALGGAIAYALGVTVASALAGAASIRTAAAPWLDAGAVGRKR